MACRQGFAAAVRLGLVVARFPHAQLPGPFVQPPAGLAAAVAEFLVEAKFPADPARGLLPDVALVLVLNCLTRAGIPAGLAAEVFGGHPQALEYGARLRVSPNPQPWLLPYEYPLPLWKFAVRIPHACCSPPNFLWWLLHFAPRRLS